MSNQKIHHNPRTIKLLILLLLVLILAVVIIILRINKQKPQATPSTTSLNTAENGETFTITKLNYGEGDVTYPFDPEIAYKLLRLAALISASWQGTDITTIPECYQICHTYELSETPGQYESSNFYVYLLDNTKPVMQHNSNGFYFALTEEHYNEIISVWEEQAGLE